MSIFSLLSGIKTNVAGSRGYFGYVFRCGRSLAERAPSFAYAASSRVNLALSCTIPLVKFKLSLDEYDTPNLTIWQCAIDHRFAAYPTAFLLCRDGRVGAKKHSRRLIGRCRETKCATQYGIMRRQHRRIAAGAPLEDRMSQEPEQIGELIYLPNPDYPYPFPVDAPPHYWMTEQTGKLAEAIEIYFGGEPLAPPQLALVRQYLQQYIERAVMTGDAKRALLLQRLAALRSTRDIEQFADDLAEIGVEPF